MTNQPPPPEMLQQWTTEYWGNPGEIIGNGERYIATKAAQWGADQELEACCEYLTSRAAWDSVDVQVLFNHRRPKPPSLHELALQMLGTIERDAHYLPEITDTIRRALEALPND